MELKKIEENIYSMFVNNDLIIIQTYDNGSIYSIEGLSKHTRNYFTNDVLQKIQSQLVKELTY